MNIRIGSLFMFGIARTGLLLGEGIAYASTNICWILYDDDDCGGDDGHDDGLSVAMVVCDDDDAAADANSPTA